MRRLSLSSSMLHSECACVSAKFNFWMRECNDEKDRQKKTELIKWTRGNRCTMSPLLRSGLNIVRNTECLFSMRIPYSLVIWFSQTWRSLHQFARYKRFTLAIAQHNAQKSRAEQSSVIKSYNTHTWADFMRAFQRIIEWAQWFNVWIEFRSFNICNDMTTSSVNHTF